MAGRFVSMLCAYTYYAIVEKIASQSEIESFVRISYFALSETIANEFTRIGRTFIEIHTNKLVGNGQ